ncbi:hypothetical protein MR810_00075 [bacterium]|nr:hypothetical protein [bacterium]
MRKVLSLFLTVAFMLVCISATIAETNVYHSVCGASTVTVKALANISCNYTGYYCSGTEFAPSASHPTDMTVTVRPYTVGNSNERRGHATTYSTDNLSDGAEYFYPYPGAIDLWANTNIYNHAACIKGYWNF